jgi:hypothetical protein
MRFGFSRHHVHAPYKGTVDETGFKISRIIHYRNSFLPVIRGRFETQADGKTVIYIQMSPHSYVMAFLGLWCFVWFGTFIPIALARGIPIGIRLIFIGMPLVLLGVFWWAFWREANRSRHDLTEIIGKLPLD